MKHYIPVLILLSMVLYSCSDTKDIEKTETDSTQFKTIDTVNTIVKNNTIAPKTENMLSYSAEDESHLLLFEKFSLGIISSELKKKFPDLKPLHAEDNNEELGTRGLQESIQEIIFLNKKGKLEFNFRNDSLYRYSIVFNEPNESKATDLYEKISNYYNKRLGAFLPVNIEEDNHYAQLNTWYLNPDYLIAIYNLNTGNITIAAQNNKPGQQQ